MRMWNVDPKLLCNQHLIGEHQEIHALVGILLKGISVEGYLEKGLLEIHTLRQRHTDLVIEMRRRKMVHLSPLPIFQEREAGKIDPAVSIEELMNRCTRCKALILQAAQQRETEKDWKEFEEANDPDQQVE